MADEFNPIATGLQIGQGEAQVFRPFENPYADKIAELQARKDAEQKQRQKNILSDVEKLSKAALNPNDQMTYFIPQSKKIYEFVRQNAEDLYKGRSPEKEIEFQNMIQDYLQKAEYSKYTRDKLEQHGLMLAADPVKANPEVLEKISKFQSIDPATGQMIPINPADFMAAPKAEKPYDFATEVKKYDKLHSPSEKLTKYVTPEGNVVTSNNQFFNNPYLQAEDMLRDDKLKAEVIRRYETLDEADKNKYINAAEKSGNTVYVEYLKDYNDTRRGLKTASGNVPKGAGLTIGFNSGTGEFNTKETNFTPYDATTEYDTVAAKRKELTDKWNQEHGTKYTPDEFIKPIKNNNVVQVLVNPIKETRGLNKFIKLPSYIQPVRLTALNYDNVTGEVTADVLIKDSDGNEAPSTIKLDKGDVVDIKGKYGYDLKGHLQSTGKLGKWNFGDTNVSSVATGGKGASVQSSSGYSNPTKVKDASGNIITIGVKNGKWFNIATGKEVK